MCDEDDANFGKRWWGPLDCIDVVSDLTAQLFGIQSL
jgi:hypothetical protein